MIYYVIPCREGSKGIPHKNRILWKYTASIIPVKQCSNTIVTSDDPVLLERAQKMSMSIINRPDYLSSDSVSTSEVMKDVIKTKKLTPEDDIVMLYLVYPNRKWADVTRAYAFYKKNNARSLLCSCETKVHPYLCLYDLNNFKGKQIVKHNLYRRQDYPKCFALSHFVCIFSVGEINNLNKNLYNSETLFYPINRDVIDVDTPSDLRKIK